MFLPLVLFISNDNPGLKKPHTNFDFNYMKKIAIVQSNYVPWKGYFDLIASVDEFILFDDMQYTRRDWRNRNLLKTPTGMQWISIPVKVKGKYHQKIRETEIDGTEWALQHWKAIELNYKKSKFFKEISNIFEKTYTDMGFTNLSKLNHFLIKEICTYLDIKTKITNSSDYQLVDGKSEKLLELTLQAGGTEYISGPAAMDYIDVELFANKDVKLTWFDYGGYKEYPQLWGQFVHGVSILDLLFNCGPESINYMKSRNYD